MRSAGIPIDERDVRKKKNREENRREKGNEKGRREEKGRSL